MRTKGVMLWGCTLLFLIGSASCHAGGRILDSKNPRSHPLVFNAWRQDSVIQIAVGNMGNAVQKIKTAVGSYDTTEHLFGSHSFSLEPKTIQRVNFPVMTQPTPRGDTQQSDTAFVFMESGGKSIEIGRLPIQQMYPSEGNVSVDNYVVETGKKIMLVYSERPADAMRMIFVAQAGSAPYTADQGQIAEGVTPAITMDSLNELGLGPKAIRTYKAMLKDNYGFVFGKGKNGLIKIEYTLDDVKDCRTVTIPIQRHVVAPPGGMDGGMGPTLLVYDPRTITLMSLPDPAATTESAHATPHEPIP